MEPIYNDARKIKPRQTEANATLMETFLFWWRMGGRRVDGAFCIPDARWKMGCHLGFYVSTRGDSRGVPAHDYSILFRK